MGEKEGESVGRWISNDDEEEDGDDQENGLVVAQLVSLQILYWTDVPSSHFEIFILLLVIKFFFFLLLRERVSFIGQLWIWFSVTDLNERNKISSPVDVKEKEQLVTDIKYSKSHLLFPHHWLLPLERFFLSLSFTFSPFFLYSLSLYLCV